MKKPRMLYVLADGGRARLVEENGPEKLRTVQEFESPARGMSSRELGRDRPSSSQESASPRRHGIEPREDPRLKVEQDFIRDVAAVIGGREFDALVVALPPRLAAVLEAALPASAAAKLRPLLFKDLTKVPDAELPKLLLPPARTSGAAS